MLLNENLFEIINEETWNPDDASSDFIDMESDKPENQPINLEEDYSSSFPQWLLNEKNLLNALSKRGVDLANAQFIEVEAPENAYAPEIKDQNLLKVYRLKYGNEQYPSYVIYIPGYNDAEQVDLLHNGKWVALKYYSMKQLLAHTVDFGFIDVSNSNNMNLDKRKERANVKKGTLNLNREKNAQYTIAPMLGYEKDVNGRDNWDKPIYGDLKWVEKSGYDKSGYPINPNKYKNLLIKLQAENSQKALDDCYAKIENTRTSIIELMSKINIKSKDSYDMFREISNASNRLSNLIYEYKNTLKSIEWYSDYKNKGIYTEEDVKKEISREIQSLIKNVNKGIEYIKEDLDRIEIINDNRDAKIEEAKITISKAEMAKLDKEVEEATKEVAKYKIPMKAGMTSSNKIINEPDFDAVPENQREDAKKAYDRYVKAWKARPDRAKDIITYTEAIEPDVNSEELQKLAKKHNIDILSPMNNGDLRLSGAGADLMKFYQEAESLGLWEVDPALYEGKEDNRSEIELLRKELALDDKESYDKFVEEELQEWESELDALKRYKQDLIDSGIDLKNLNESYIKEAMLNVDKSAVFDAITNARAYVEENNFYAAEDALLYAAKLVKTPKIEEGGVKRNLLDVEYLKEEIKSLKEEIDALKYGIENAGTKGGNFEISDIPELEDELEQAMQKLAEKENELNNIEL